jgi:tRNA(Ile)-lysidine synthase
MSRNIISSIDQFIEQHHLIHDGNIIIIGFSGGPDSVFLLHYVHERRKHRPLTLVAAHLDHGWRPDSAQDASWCKNKAASLQIEFVQAHASDFADQVKPEGSQEDYGRQLRRAFFQHVAHQFNATSIALAHHADDQQETFFIRLVRGAHLAGLCGMRPRSGLYIRPLLEISKAEILAYLDANNISYLCDPSNESLSFLRNRIRHMVIPALRAADQRFDQNFFRSLTALQDVEDFLEETTKKIFNEIIEKEESTTLKLSEFQKLPPLLQRRILIHWLIVHKIPFTLTESFIHEILRFIASKSPSAQHQLGPSWFLEKKQSTLILRYKIPNGISLSTSGGKNS